MKTLKKKAEKWRNKKLPHRGQVFYVTSYEYTLPNIIALEYTETWRNRLKFKIHHGERDDVPKGLWWSYSYRKKDMWYSIPEFIKAIEDEKLKAINTSEFSKLLLLSQKEENNESS